MHVFVMQQELSSLGMLGDDSAVHIHFIWSIFVLNGVHKLPGEAPLSAEERSASLT